MSEAYHGAAMPAKTNQPFFWVVYPKRGTRVIGVCLADKFLGQLQHFRRRSFGCHRTPQCPYCLDKIPFVWGGYIAFQLLPGRDRKILMISQHAARDVLAIREKYGTLRGVKLELWRKDDLNAQSTVLVRDHGRADPNSLLREHPILPSLNRLWGINDSWLSQNDAPTMEDSPACANLGAPIPSVALGDDYDKPTVEQMERLRRVREGMGEFA